MHIKNLDAVRGWAALIVCFSHIPPMTQPSFGAAGVWIFFVLSGFLLSISFENRPTRQVNQAIPAYLLRRLFRILPVYCLVIPVYALMYKYLYTDHYTDWAISHLSFQKADGHFWSVKVELIFYLVLPFILLGLSFLKNKKQKLVVLFLLSGVVYYFFEAKKMMAITGGSGQVCLYFTPFILGVFLSVIRNDLSAKLCSILFHIGTFLIIFLCLDIKILETSIFRSGFEVVNNLGWNYSFLFYPISCIAIIGAYKGSSYLLRLPFIQSVGRCGYSFYLWHMVVIVLLSGFITQLSDIRFLRIDKLKQLK